MKFARRKLLSKMMESFGKENVKNLRTYHLAEDLSKNEPNSPKRSKAPRSYEAPSEAVSCGKPKRPIS